VAVGGAEASEFSLSTAVIGETIGPIGVNLSRLSQEPERQHGPGQEVRFVAGKPGESGVTVAVTWLRSVDEPLQHRRQTLQAVGDGGAGKAAFGPV
jgi:hypothetical protein